jgi:MFS superfamily sulfate permease-like transporter
MLYESEPQAFAVVLDCEQMTVIDMTGAIALEDLTDELRENDVSVHLARVHGDAFEVARRSGVLDKIGDANIHTTVAEAVDAALTAATSKGEN